MVWYLLRSTGSFRAASARAAASEIGVPFRLAALSSLSPPGLGVRARRACKQIAGTSRRLCLRRCRRAASALPLLLPRVRGHIGRIDLRIFGDAAGQGGKLHRLQERDQLARVRLMHRKLVERHVQLDLVVEQHQLPRDPRLLGILHQRLAPLRLLDFAGTQQQRFEIAIFDDQLRRGLDADAGHARHVVGGIAGQRLHLDHLFRRHAEFLDHLGDADAAILHGVVHHDLVGHELHQILVGGHDGRGRAALAGLPRIGRDQIVGLETALFQAGQVEGAHRLADQREIAGSDRPAPAAGAPCSQDRACCGR